MNTGAFDPLVDVAAIAHERRRVAPRRRRIRDVGARLSGAPAPRRRRRARGLVDGRRSQVAQRPVRLRDRHRPRRGRPPLGDDARRGVLHRDGGRRARRVQLGAGELTPRARCSGLGRHQRAGADRPCRARRAQLPPRPPDRRAPHHGRRRPILNDVVLNQVLVRVDDDDAVTREAISGIQADGTCWLGPTTWHGMGAMRISVSNWSTQEADADRSADAIARSIRKARRPEGAVV